MLSLRNIHHSYDGIQVLEGINLELVSGEILCLLGPSGCGKTTLLRLIAGLEPVEQGDILLDGKSIISIPVHLRDFGLMFQDYALFPHIDVAANIAFGIKMQQHVPTFQQQRVIEMLELVNLVGFQKRDVAQLSGGERQRIALARSLAPNPRLLMLDEPLGSLDAALRDELIVELRHIIKQLGLTALYVTHDQREAFAISDRIALMNEGQIEQLSTPQTLYQQPATIFVARFLGLDNILPILRRNANSVETPIGELTISGGDLHAILLHPDGLRISSEPTASSVAVVITESVFQGDYCRLHVRHTSGSQLTLKIPIYFGSLPAVGEPINLQILPESIIPLAR